MIADILLGACKEWYFPASSMEAITKTLHDVVKSVMLRVKAVPSKILRILPLFPTINVNDDSIGTIDNFC